MYNICNILEYNNRYPNNIFNSKVIPINIFSLVNKDIRHIIIEYISSILKQIKIDTITNVFNFFNQIIFIDNKKYNLDDVFNKFFIQNKDNLEKIDFDKQVILVLEPGFYEITGNHNINFNLKIIGLTKTVKQENIRVIVKKVWYLSDIFNRVPLFRSDDIPLFNINNIDNIKKEKKINFSINNIEFIHTMVNSIVTICNSNFPFLSSNELIKINFELINCKISGKKQNIKSFNSNNGVINIYSSNNTNCHVKIIDCTFSDLDIVLIITKSDIEYINNKCNNIINNNIIEN